MFVAHEPAACEKDTKLQFKMRAPATEYIYHKQQLSVNVEQSICREADFVPSDFFSKPVHLRAKVLE